MLLSVIASVALAATPSARPADSSTDAFAEWHADELMPWCISEARTGSFRGRDKVDLAYASFVDGDNSNGTLIISSGRTESWVKYCEVIYDLQDLGMDIWIVDHRGQGFSDRMLKNTDKGYVDSFDDYVKDFEEFVEDVVCVSESDDVYILGHSMGGAIATRYTAGNESMVDGLVLSAPMFEVKAPPLSESVAYWTAWAALWWFGDDYLPGGGDYYDYSFDGNGVTNSTGRFTAHKNLESVYPATQMGSATYRWLYEAIDKTIEIDDMGKGFSVPTLLLSAGKDERVSPGRQKDFCANADDCEFVNFSSGAHELMNDVDSIRDDVMDEVKGFFGAS